MKACTVNGCDKPHRARGFCITHYNEMHAGPERHRTTKRCECCGVSYITTRTNGRFCSYLCRDYTRWGPRAVPVRRPKQRQPKPKPPVLGPRDCAWCGSTFQPRSVRNAEHPQGGWGSGGVDLDRREGDSGPYGIGEPFHGPHQWRDAAGV